MSDKQLPYALYVEFSGHFEAVYSSHSLLEGSQTSHRFFKSLHQAVHDGCSVKHSGLAKKTYLKGHISIVMPGYNPMYWAT